MEKSGIKCVGWGSPSKRPLSWVVGSQKSSQISDYPPSNSRTHHARSHTPPVTNDSYRRRGYDDPCLEESALRNSRCKSLIENTSDLCKMYEYPPAAVTLNKGNDLNCSSQRNGNYVYGSVDRIENQCRQPEIFRDFYGSQHCVDPRFRPHDANGVDPCIVNTNCLYTGLQYGSGQNIAYNDNVSRPYTNNLPHLVDHNVNLLDSSPENALSSGSSFDSGYHSSYGSRPDSGAMPDKARVSNSSHGDRETGSARNSPLRVPHRAPHHTPYRLSQDLSSYQAGIKRTLDKCEDHCLQVIHPSLVWAELQSEWESIILVKYIGSFSVIGEDQHARAEYVRKQLLEMRNVTKTKPVLLVISLSGIKVCSSTGESVYMAHALKRISYATCDPDNCQFSFLAREPKGHTNIQYCHGFMTKSPIEAEELNAIVGNAFKMAFTYQRESQQKTVQSEAKTTPEPAETTTTPPTMQRQPTFHELIEQQIVEQREQNVEIERKQQDELTKRLSEISTTKIDERMKELQDRKKKEQEQLEREQEQRRLQLLQGKDRTSWAKHVAGRSKHKSPLRIPIANTMGDPQSKPSTASPQSQRQSGTPTSQSNGGFSFSPSSSNIKASPFTSISALRDAFIAGELRSYGSPVMTLKETIDKIAWSGEFTSSCSDIRHSHGSTSSQDNVDCGENITEPTSPEPGPSCGQTTGGPDFSQRPLPATPPEVQRRAKPKVQKSANQKSPPLDNNISGGQSSRPQSNGHVQSSISRRSRPLSGKYQNESPMHNRVIETVEDGDEYQGPPTPLRFDSLRKIDRSDAPIEEDLKNAPWYQSGIPREIALEMLSQEEIGSFVVRDSTTHPGCYALSVKVPKYDNPSGISHYLILRTTHGGVKLKGLDKEWSSLTSLVTHHSVMRELLPCALRLPRTANNPAFRADDKSCEQEEDEDYQRLADFSHMMQDLKM